MVLAEIVCADPIENVDAASSVVLSDSRIADGLRRGHVESNNAPSSSRIPGRLHAEGHGRRLRNRGWNGVGCSISAQA